MGGKAECRDIPDIMIQPFNVEIIFPDGDNDKSWLRIERYFKRSYPDVCSFRDKNDSVRPFGFPITEIWNRNLVKERRLVKVNLFNGYFTRADCSILLINESDISSIRVNRPVWWPCRFFGNAKAVLVIVSEGESTDESFKQFVFEVDNEWNGIVICDSKTSPLDDNAVLKSVRCAVYRRKLCIAGRGRKTVEKVQTILDESLRDTGIKTERLHITSSKIQTNLKSVTHAICCADRSERNILFSDQGEPDELTLTVNYFKKAKKPTLIIECGGEDPAEDQLYDADVFNDSMKRGQPRLKAFIDKNCFISLSEKLNERQKKAILCWLGRDENETAVQDIPRTITD